MHRRRFVQALTLFGLFGSRRSFAFGRSSQLTFALLDAGDAGDREKAWARLGVEIEARTSVSVAKSPRTIDIDTPELFDYPMVFCVGQGAVPEWPEARWRRLAHYVRSGGMVYFDSLQPGDGFGSRCLDRLLRLLPTDAEQKLTKEHVLYRSFYLLEHPVGRGGDNQQPRIAQLDGRMVAVAVDHDVAGALMRDEFGGWAFSCEPGGESQREHAIRFGVNLVMYALCTDYKADQVHIPFLLKRRQ